MYLTPTNDYLHVYGWTHNCVKHFSVCVDWTFVLLLPSLSLVSTPPLIQLLSLPVVDQASIIPNISITNVKNAFMLFTQYQCYLEI